MKFYLLMFREPNPVWKTLPWKQFADILHGNRGQNCHVTCLLTSPSKKHVSHLKKLRNIGHVLCILLQDGLLDCFLLCVLNLRSITMTFCTASDT